MSIPTDKNLLAAIAVTRFGLGAKAGEMDAARADPRGFLTAQITPGPADQPPGDLATSAVLFTQAAEARKMAKDDPQNAKAAQMVRRDALISEIEARAALDISTDAAFRERWVLFWSNHFTASATKGEVTPIAGAFEREAIRPYAFGRFEDMLVASTRHPAMLLYLDQQRSAGAHSPASARRPLGLNENLAREIMELHTVGLDAGYTQADVTEFARALTGWSLQGAGQAAAQGAQAEPGEYLYRPALHEPGPRTVLGRTYNQEGEDQARAILADLAANPATAKHLAVQLSRHFVADDPPPALVARLQTAFSRSHGRLDQVAKALISAPEAWDPTPRKFKMPYEFLISSYRAIGVPPSNPQRFAGALNLLGQRPFTAPSPKGWPDIAADWTAPDAIVKRMAWSEQFAQAVGDKVDPNLLAQAALGPRLGERSQTAIRRAESRPEAIALLLMSPEFQRR